MNYRLISITLSILSGSCFLVNNKIECAPKNQLDKEKMCKMEAPLKERPTQLKKEFKKEKLTKDECLARIKGSNLLATYNYEEDKGFRERHPNWNSIGSGLRGIVIGTGATIYDYLLFVLDNNEGCSLDDY